MRESKRGPGVTFDVAFPGVFLTDIPASLEPSEAAIRSDQNKSDRLRDALVRRTTTKQTPQPALGTRNGLIWAGGAPREVGPCATLVEQGYQKGEGQLPKRA